MPDHDAIPWASWREAKGYSQTELAEKAHIDASTISKIEAGERAPSTRMIVALALVLGLTDRQRLEALEAAARIGAPQGREGASAS